MQATFLSEEALGVEATLTVWLLPVKIFEGIDCRGTDERARRRSHLSPVLTTIAHQLNNSAHSGGCSSFAQLVEKYLV